MFKVTHKQEGLTDSVQIQAFLVEEVLLGGGEVEVLQVTKVGEEVGVLLVHRVGEGGEVFQKEEEGQEVLQEGERVEALQERERVVI